MKKRCKEIMIEDNVYNSKIMKSIRYRKCTAVVDYKNYIMKEVQ